MITHKPFLITRPQQQSSELIAAIEKQGDSCIHFPCIEISKPTDQQSIAFAITHFDQFDLCIFTSTNAVLPQLKEVIHRYKKTLIAIGPATAKQLANNTEKLIVVPHTHSSEGLLELSELQSVSGLNIAIFTGENPKNLLKESLNLKGALVEYIICYRRSCPNYTTQQIDRIVQYDYAAIITTSKETLNNLISLFNHYKTWLVQQPIIVISTSMADIAQTYGFQEIIINKLEGLWRLPEDKAKI
jgi:uroporphyrinogen-III synthase